MKNKRIGLFVILALSIVFLFQSSTDPQQPVAFQAAAAAPQIQNFNQLPLYFIENSGQLDESIAYHLKMPGGNVHFANDSISYQFVASTRKAEPMPPPQPDENRIGSEPISVETLRVRFEGANDSVKIVGAGEQEARFNFYQGAEPDSWIEGAQTFAKVKYKNLYSGIDMVVYENKGLLKQEYRVRPGGSVSDICVAYEGAQSVRVNDRGQLEIQTPSRTLIEDTPFTYQLINGKRICIPSSYIVQTTYSSPPEHTVKFSVGSYDPEHALIIDPSIVYSTFLGRSVSWSSIAVDLSLNAYVVGSTTANDFPTTPGAFDATGDGRNVLLACLNPSGTDLVYATYFGGSDSDSGLDIAFSWGDNSAVIVGTTGSTDLPTTANAYDHTLDGESDVFLAKFRSNGRLAFATYFGGSDEENKAHVAIDGQGKIYLSGITTSSDFPTTPNAYDPTYNSPSNLYVAAFNSNGTSLIYSTFFGGYAWIGDIAVDFYGHAYITGDARGGTIPITPGTFGESYTGDRNNGFIARFNPTGTALLFSTWLGEIPNRKGYYTHVRSEDIDVDGQGNIYVTGIHTYEEIYAASVSHRFDASCFVKKLNASASQKPWEKEIGGSYDYNSRLVVDGRGGLYVLGTTDSGPRTGLFIQKLKTSNGETLHTTFLRGSEWDWGYGIVTDSFGSVYVTGITDSFDFPTTPGVFQSDFIGESHGFVTRIRDGAPKGEISALPQTINVKVPAGSTTAKNRNLKISNEGAGVVSYQVNTDQSWLTVKPAGGSVRNEVDQITVTIDPINIKKAGTYKGVVRISSLDAFNSPAQIPVKLKVKGPTIRVKRKKYSLKAIEGSTTPIIKANKIKNKGPGTLRYKLKSLEPWIKVKPKRGNSTGEWDEFSIEVDPTGLAAGIHQGIIQVISKDTVDSPVDIIITLNIQE